MEHNFSPFPTRDPSAAAGDWEPDDSVQTGYPECSTSAASSIIDYAWAVDGATTLSREMCFSLVASLITQGLVENGKAPDYLFPPAICRQIEAAYQAGLDQPDPFWLEHPRHGALLSDRTIKYCYPGLEKFSGLRQLSHRNMFIARDNAFEQY